MIEDMLARTCKNVESVNELGILPNDVKQWWKDYKKANEEKTKAEQERIAKLNKVINTLAKLTPEEKKILNVDEQAVIDACNIVTEE